jgi:hypothetical protein
MANMKEKAYGRLSLVVFRTEDERMPLNFDVRLYRDDGVVLMALSSWYEELEMKDFFDHLVETNWLPMRLVMGSELDDEHLNDTLVEWRNMVEDRAASNPLVIPE